MGTNDLPELPADELEDHYRRRGAAHQRAAAAHEQAAETERQAADALERVGETARAGELRDMAAANDEKASRSRQIADGQLEQADEQHEEVQRRRQS